ncbi:MAG: hypothetical protein JXR94_20290 [Candidatus Hydrogenedentes bacterium]|nr:hypothetical protein [Candidatus Hydrogenedentota bacterium]
MGTGSVPAVDPNSLLFSSLFSKSKPASADNQLALFGTRGAPCHRASDIMQLLSGRTAATDSYSANREAEIDDEFSALVYSSQMQKASLSVQFSEAAASLTRAGEDGESAVELEARQLSFEFYAEVRTEELALFRERTGAVADELEGTQRESFVQMSQRVAARFSMSLEVSSTVLSGYSGAAESLPAADEATSDNFLAFVNEALGNSDDVLNQIFELLGDFFGGEGDLQTRFNEFLEGLSDLGLVSLPEAPAGDGTTVQYQSFSFNMQLEFEFEFESTEVVQQSDPIIFDLDNDGFEMSSYANGARFDIEGNGAAVTTAFVNGGDAFLAMDRNGNGVIDSGQELFGDQHGAANGFEELRKLDSNHDGRINELDDDFDNLVLFKDDGDGVTEDGELIGLAEAGISEINLGYRNVNQVGGGGNPIAQLASFTMSDGTRGRVGDAILNFIA